MTGGDFTLEELAATAARIIRLPGLALAPGGSASAVPGWDSLNHTLITFEIASRRGIALDAEETAALPDFAGLVALVNRRLGAAGGS
jgi:hypothetical protein